MSPGPAALPICLRVLRENGAVVIAAITSRTNTANPGLMVAAGLLARNAARPACPACRGA